MKRNFSVPDSSQSGVVPTVLDFRTSAPAVTTQSVELEEGILGSILLDPSAIAAVENLPIPAFEISAHRVIFKMMLELHHQGLKPDAPTVAFKMSELGTLKSEGRYGLVLPKEPIQFPNKEKLQKYISLPKDAESVARIEAKVGGQG